MDQKQSWPNWPSCLSRYVFKQNCHNVLRGRTEPTSSFSLPILFLDLSIQQRTGEWLTWHLSTHFSPLPSCSGRTAGLGQGCFNPYVTSFIIDQIIFQKDQTNHPKWVKIHKTMIMFFSFIYSETIKKKTIKVVSTFYWCFIAKNLTLK